MPRTDPNQDWNNPEVENGLLRLLERYRTYVQGLSNALEASAVRIPRSWREPPPDDEPLVFDVSIPLSMSDGSTYLARQAEHSGGPSGVWAYEKAKWADANVLTYAGLPERFRSYWEQMRSYQDMLSDFEFVGYKEPGQYDAEPVESGVVISGLIDTRYDYLDGEYQGRAWARFNYDYHSPEMDTPVWSGSLDVGYNHQTIPQLLDAADDGIFQVFVDYASWSQRWLYHGVASVDLTPWEDTCSRCSLSMDTGAGWTPFRNDTATPLDIAVSGASSITVTAASGHPTYSLYAAFNVYVSGTLEYSTQSTVIHGPDGPVTCSHSGSYMIVVPAHSTVYFEAIAQAWQEVHAFPGTALPLPSTQSAEVSYWGRTVSFSKSYP